MKEKAGYFIVLSGALFLAISATVLGVVPGLFVSLEQYGGITPAFLFKVALFFLLQVGVLFVVGRLNGAAAMASCDIIALLFLYLSTGPDFRLLFGSSSVPLFLMFATLSYYGWRNLSARGMLEELGIRREGLGINLAYGIGGFIILLLLVRGLVFITDFTGIGDYAKASERLSGMPVLFFISAVALAPLAEEVFFRGFLFRRYGYLFSSAAFSAAHLFYGSWVQLLSAFAIGLALCALFSMRQSLIPPLVAHSLYNIAFVFTLLF